MRTRTPRRPSFILLFAFSISCGEKTEPDAIEPTQGSAFLVGTRVWDDVSTTSYFHVVPSIDDRTSIDTSNALEIPGAAKLYAVAGIGWFGVGGGESPTITRYMLGDGGLEAKERISLQPYGVQSLWDTLYVVSPTKMYYPDRANRQLIVINPREMIIEGTVQLPETAREGYLSLYGYAPVVRDQHLLFSVGWFDWETNDTVLGETGLVVLDTVTDAVVRFDVDGRCGGITQPITLASGDTYLVSSALASAAHRLGRLGTEPCALRIPAGDDTFDASYLVPLSEVTASALAGEPVPAGGEALFLRVFDEGAGTVEAGNATWELTGQSAWQWWRWDVADQQAARVAELPASTADVLWFEVDGRVFGTETKTDYSETTLIDLTADGGAKRALTVPGFLHAVARIR